MRRFVRSPSCARTAAAAAAAAAHNWFQVRTAEDNSMLKRGHWNIKRRSFKRQKPLWGQVSCVMLPTKSKKRGCYTYTGLWLTSLSWPINSAHHFPHRSPTLSQSIITTTAFHSNMFWGGIPPPKCQFTSPPPQKKLTLPRPCSRYFPHDYDFLAKGMLVSSTITTHVIVIRDVFFANLLNQGGKRERNKITAKEEISCEFCLFDKTKVIILISHNVYILS